MAMVVVQALSYRGMCALLALLRTDCRTACRTGSADYLLLYEPVLCCTYLLEPSCFRATFLSTNISC